MDKPTREERMKELNQILNSPDGLSKIGELYRRLVPGDKPVGVGGMFIGILDAEYPPEKEEKK